MNQVTFLRVHPFMTSVVPRTSHGLLQHHALTVAELTLPPALPLHHETTIGEGVHGHQKIMSGYRRTNFLCQRRCSHPCRPQHRRLERFPRHRCLQRHPRLWLLARSRLLCSPRHQTLIGKTITLDEKASDTANNVKTK